MICKTCKQPQYVLNSGMCYDCYTAQLRALEAKREARRRRKGRNRGLWHYDKLDGVYWAWPGVERGEVHRDFAHWGPEIYWVAWYGERWLGKFKTLKRAKAWIEEVTPLIDDGEGYGTGPEAERGPDWFGNDGLDGRTDAAVAQHSEL